MTLSDGSSIRPLHSFRKHEKKLAALQRKLAKRTKFSANWQKLKARIQRLHRKIANVRNDFLHKATTAISKNHAVVVIEDLTVRNMSRSASGTLEAPGKNVRAKAGLNKSILDQGWFEFRRQLAYKLAWPGGNLLVIPPQYTSQTCSRYHALRAHFAIENICRSDTLACRLPLEASAFRGGRQMTHRKGITQRRIWGAVKHASPVSVNIFRMECSGCPACSVPLPPLLPA